MIQNRVIKELNDELKLSSQPGYSSRYDEDYNEELLAMPPAPPASPKKSEGDGEAPAVRVDQRSEKQPTPHKPNPDVSSGRSKPAVEDFGKGIFD